MCSTMLDCMLLCYTIWYYVKLYGIVILCGTMLNSMVLCYTISYYVKLYGTMLYYMALC